MIQKPTSICVFCGSSPGARPAYLEAARNLGAVLASRGCELVFGGGSVGLMGAVADATLAAGGRAVGVIPEFLNLPGVAHERLTALEVVDGMHARKARMAELSDGFVALPGGFGTLEELTEVLTWAQLGRHAKPCGMLNVDGYFDRLAEFLDHAVGERFLRQPHRDLLIADRDPIALLDAMAAHEAPVLRKWMDERQD